MTFQAVATITLGAGHSGLVGSLHATVVGIDGSVLIPATTSGIIEPNGGGAYEYRFTADSDWAPKVVVRWTDYSGVAQGTTVEITPPQTSALPTPITDISARASNFVNRMLARLIDNDCEDFTLEQCYAGLTGAVQEYSRYFPCYRMIGTGTVVKSVSSSTQLRVYGGPFTVGDKLYAMIGNAELATITAVGVEDTNVGVPGTYYVLSLDTPVTFSVGEEVYSFLGIKLVTGSFMYSLPQGFNKVDNISMDIALGTRSDIEVKANFYDMLYSDYLNTIPTSIGSAMNFSSGYWPWYTTFLLAGGSFPTQVVFRFASDDERATLSIMPTPAAPANIEKVWYYKNHIFDTIPSKNEEALMNYALYATVNAKAVHMGTMLNGEDFTYKDAPADNAQVLMKIAQEYYKGWLRLIKRATIRGM